MSGSSTSWSDNPNAPQIPYWLYFAEKWFLAGVFVGAVFYGIAVILFIQCMGALLNPIDRTRGGIRWGLVAHAVTMFSALTLNTVMGIDIESVSYIGEFPHNHVIFPPGATGVISPEVSYIEPIAMFCLNACLADGLLLYRCYVIYSMNYRVIILPCLVYFVFLALSIMKIYYRLSPKSEIASNRSFAEDLEMPYFSISLSLNILLTLMIATRLIRHSRNIRSTIWPARDNELYNTVVTILVESCVLYAVASALYIASLDAESNIIGITWPIFFNIQVIASFLILLRVANRTALTSGAVASGNSSSYLLNGRGEPTGSNGTPPDGNPISSMGTDEEAPDEPGAGTENMIEEVPL